MGHNILILGNGFDLYHKLPTRYSDFMFLATEWDSFYNEYQPERNDSDKKIRTLLGDSGELTHEALAEYGKNGSRLNQDKVEYLNKNLKNNAWIQYFKELGYSHLKWIDFESEIQNALLATEEYSMETIPQHVGELATKDESERLQRIPRIFGHSARNGYVNYGQTKVLRKNVDRESLRGNKKLLVAHMVKELNILIECLRIYLKEFVLLIDPDIYSEQIKSMGIVDIINFNYIDTYSAIYGTTTDTRCHFIHGNVDDGNIVLGVSDEAFEDSVDYIYFQKFFQRIQKRTGSEYRSFLKRYTSQYGSQRKKSVYIMGHSLGEHDFCILREILNNSIANKVTIYYHSQKSYENLVINLVKAYGREQVVDYVGKGWIVFEKLQAPQVID